MKPPRRCAPAPQGGATHVPGEPVLRVWLDGQRDAAPAEVANTAAERLARYTRPGTLNLAALPPLSIYVHLPWCLKKCPYCDFNSHELNGGVPEARYLDALRADLEAALPFIWGRRIHSIFIGGGTPSLFSPEGIDRLLGDIRARLPLEPGCEVTLEANPGTFERERFRAFRGAGVTRLSVGVQSFDDAKLRALGRVHDARQAIAAVEEARDAFDTFNLDLMYALPGQTLAELDAELTQALALAPPHLSIYHLTIEANTLFAVRPPPALCGRAHHRALTLNSTPWTGAQPSMRNTTRVPWSFLLTISQCAEISVACSCIPSKP